MIGARATSSAEVGGEEYLTIETLVGPNPLGRRWMSAFSRGISSRAAGTRDRVTGRVTDHARRVTPVSTRISRDAGSACVSDTGGRRNNRLVPPAAWGPGDLGDK